MNRRLFAGGVIGFIGGLFGGRAAATAGPEPNQSIEQRLAIAEAWIDMRHSLDTLPFPVTENNFRMANDILVEYANKLRRNGCDASRIQQADAVVVAHRAWARSQGVAIA